MSNAHTLMLPCSPSDAASWFFGAHILMLTVEHPDAHFEASWCSLVSILMLTFEHPHAHFWAFRLCLGCSGAHIVMLTSEHPDALMLTYCDAQIQIWRCSNPEEVMLTSWCGDAHIFTSWCGDVEMWMWRCGNVDIAIWKFESGDLAMWASHFLRLQNTPSYLWCSLYEFVVCFLVLLSLYVCPICVCTIILSFCVLFMFGCLFCDLLFYEFIVHVIVYDFGLGILDWDA